MGEVWRAVDTKLARPVAVKMLHPALADDATFRQRFSQEARTVAALRAPGVVNLYDACEEPSADGSVRCYLVMEYVAGHSLADLLAMRGRLSVPSVLSLVAQAAEALEAAHAAGVIHRDVKPGNILLGPDGQVTLVDFGIARVAGTAGMTSTGMVMGTLSYASPEHLLGRDLTTASDVYSLGVVAYECLAGTLPFTTDSPAATITSQLRDTPPPLPSDVPTVVARVVLRAIAKKPDDRFGSAAEFAMACHRAAAAVTAPAGPDSYPSTMDIVSGRTAGAARPARPRRSYGAVIAASMVVALIAVVAGIGLWSSSPPEGQATPGPSGSGTPAAAPSRPGGSAAPTQRRTPTPQRSPIAVVGGRSGRCLAVTAGTAVKLGGCQSGNEFRFLTVSGRSSTFQVVPATGSRRCLYLGPESSIRTGSCRSTRSWKMTWVTTADGWHHWKLQYTGTRRCLGLKGSSTPIAGPCDGKDLVRWRTRSQ